MRFHTIWYLVSSLHIFKYCLDVITTKWSYCHSYHGLQLSSQTIKRLSFFIGFMTIDMCTFLNTWQQSITFWDRYWHCLTIWNFSRIMLLFFQYSYSTDSWNGEYPKWWIWIWHYISCNTTAKPILNQSVHIIRILLFYKFIL